MKLTRISVFFVFFVSFIVFNLSVKSALACDGFETDYTADNAFAFTARGCSGDFGVNIYNNEGELLFENIELHQSGGVSQNTFTFSNPGVYRVTLVSNGGEAFSQSITVDPQPITPPKEIAETPSGELGCEHGGLNTALGCINVVDFSGFAGSLINFGVGLGGGVALVLIAYASFRVSTSQGDPTQLQAAKELLSAAIIGLLMIVFSVFILRLLGITVLGLF